MPTYEYGCLICGHQFEAFHGINAKSVQKCPECGGKVERKISAGTGLVFKGSGFYITDYKNNKTNSKPETKPTEKKDKAVKTEAT